MRAMDAGPLTELRTRYGDIKDAEGFNYSEELGPSIVFKPKRYAEIRSHESGKHRGHQDKT
jgi:hypothetical protein